MIPLPDILEKTNYRERQHQMPGVKGGGRADYKRAAQGNCRCWNCWVS